MKQDYTKAHGTKLEPQNLTQSTRTSNQHTAISTQLLTRVCRSITGNYTWANIFQTIV